MTQAEATTAEKPAMRLIDYKKPTLSGPRGMSILALSDIMTVIVQTLAPGRLYDLSFALQPDDQIIPAGKRIALMIFSSDRDFTLWPEPGTRLTIDLDGAMIGARFDLRSGRIAGGTFDGVFLGLDLHLPKPTERVKLQVHGVFNMVDVYVPKGTPVQVRGPGFPFNLVDRGSGDPKNPATPGYTLDFAGVFSRIGVNEEPGG